MGAINAYVRELGRALHGPRRAKADLLAEARDGLVDAAEAYARNGLPPECAERRAVLDFGSVPRVAPAYQIELGAVQSRRTALLICAVVAPQHVVWDLAERGAPRPWTPGSASPG